MADAIYLVTSGSALLFVDRLSRRTPRWMSMVALGDYNFDWDIASSGARHDKRA
jgi:hypothetical protein